jgi:plastocyanin
MGRRMRVVVLSATAVATLSLVPCQAQAGGGCHSGVTEGTGDTIGLVDACFTPTILRVDPGATVTFVNKDPFAHNVTANGWGHFDKLAPGDSFTASFNAAGTYPFACTIHPGMSGAIVVGDGIGAVANNAVTTGTLSGESRTPGGDGFASPGSDGRIVAGALGLAGGLALGLSFGVLRRRLARA